MIVAASFEVKDLDDDGVVGEVFDEEGCYAESDKL